MVTFERSAVVDASDEVTDEGSDEREPGSVNEVVVLANTTSESSLTRWRARLMRPTRLILTTMNDQIE